MSIYVNICHTMTYSDMIQITMLKYSLKNETCGKSSEKFATA